MANYETHDFYCMNCGKRVYPIMRKKSHRHERFHRKSLYCPYCKVEVNCIEIRDFEDKEWFNEQYAEGAFIEEAQQSIKYLKEHALCI